MLHYCLGSSIFVLVLAVLIVISNYEHYSSLVSCLLPEHFVHLSITLLFDCMIIIYSNEREKFSIEQTKTLITAIKEMTLTNSRTA